MKAGTAIDEAVSEAPTCSRESGIMDIVDRDRAEVAMSAAPNGASRNVAVDEGSASSQSANGLSANSLSANSESMNGASLNGGPPPSQRDVEVDIHTEETPSPPAVAVRSVAHSAPVSVIEETTIEVADDEIEAADPSLSRASLPPPPPSSGAMRSRPPAPPSSRPRPPGSSSLPPPRHLVNGASRPPGVDPWLLANKTLELSHAQARITELEEQVAFRDARILELEENLQKARRKLDDLEARSRPGMAGIVAATGAPSSSPIAASPVAASPVAASPVAAGPVLDGRVAATQPERPALAEARPSAGAAPEAAALPAAPRGDARATGAADDEDDELDPAFGSDDAGDSRFGGEGLGAVMGGGSDDNLQQISGIGPRFEAALRKHGITRLSQIAAWSDADVRQVAKALKIPKSRIVKGRWVEVAREVIGTRAASE
jgi:predicted flap endonuclease-1-like 5' DNA nuclease